MDNFQLFKVRDLGAAINDTFSFVKNDKLFLRKILVVIVPLYAVIGIFGGLATQDISTLMTEMLSGMANGGMDNDKMEELMLKMQQVDYTRMGLLYAAIVLGTMIMKAVASSFTYNYVKAKVNQEEITEEEVNTFFTKDIGWYIGYSLLIGLLTWAVMLVIGLIVGLIAVFSKTFGVILLFPLIIFAFYLAINYLSLLFPVCFFENLGFGAALSRGAALMKGNFWETFGFLIVISLIAGSVASMFSFIMGLFGGIFGGLGASLFSQIAQYALTGASVAFMGVATAIWYGTLRNRAEGAVSMGGYDDLIDEIGKK